MRSEDKSILEELRNGKPSGERDHWDDLDYGGGIKSPRTLMYWEIMRWNGVTQDQSGWRKMVYEAKTQPGLESRRVRKRSKRILAGSSQASYS